MFFEHPELSARLLAQLDARHEGLVWTIPCSRAAWERARRAFAPDGYQASAHWRNRRSDFAYHWAAGAVAVTGYFRSHFVGREALAADPQAFLESWRQAAAQEAFARSQGVAVPCGASRRRLLEDTFDRSYANLVRAALPTLANAVEIYHLAKYADIAAALSGLVGRLEMAAPLDAIEIGAGSGLLQALLFRMGLARRSTLVDLAEVQPFAFFALHAAGLDGEIRLPGETGDGAFRFVPASAASALETDSADVAFNVTSFQEMNAAQVEEYLSLIARVLRPGGVLVSVNREAKVGIGGVDLMREADYPWPKGWEVVVDEEDLISRWSRWDWPIRRTILRKPLSAGGSVQVEGLKV